MSTEDEAPQSLTRMGGPEVNLHLERRRVGIGGPMVLPLAFLPEFGENGQMAKGGKKSRSKDVEKAISLQGEGQEAPPETPPTRPRSKYHPQAKTLEDLPPEWEDILLAEMENGASLQEIKALLHISNKVHTRWMEEPRAGEDGQETPDPNGDYREAVKRGLELSEAWWLRKGRTNLSNKEFSPVLWHMNMQNRYGWSHKTEGKVDLKGKVSSTVKTAAVNLDDLEDLFDQVEPPKKEVP